MLILLVACFNMEKNTWVYFWNYLHCITWKELLWYVRILSNAFWEKLLLKVYFYTIKYNVARLMLLWNLSDIISIYYQEKHILFHQRHVFDLMSKLCMVYKTYRDRKVVKSLLIRKKQYHVVWILTNIVNNTSIIRLYYCSTN